MNTILTSQLHDGLSWRYATKQFDPRRKISPETWAALEEAIVLTPSSFGLAPWKAVIVTDQSVREKLLEASWGQRQVADASHLVVFAAKKNLGESDIDAFLSRVAGVRGVPKASLDGFRGMLVNTVISGMNPEARTAWAARQAYIALGNLLTSAALLGIDACPMEGFAPTHYDEILGLAKHGLTATVLCPVGYRAETDKYAAAKKVRFPAEDVFLRV
jgi:nitroreductase